MSLNKAQNLIIFQISRLQSKVANNTQNHENLDLYREWQSTDANNVMAQMLELSDKDFKAGTIKKKLKQAIKSILETKVKLESKWKFYNWTHNNQNKNYPPDGLVTRMLMAEESMT